jgi:hypothetical protein
MRLKLLGLLRSSDSAADLEMVQALSPTYPARPRRAMIMQIAAFDWNCPQHIPVRFEEEDVKDQLAERDARIADLKSRLRT